MKFCKDCRWCKPPYLKSPADIPFATCQSPQRKRSYVTGEFLEVSCDNCRSPAMALLPERCGPDARWFEPKEPANVPPHS